MKKLLALLLALSLILTLAACGGKNRDNDDDIDDDTSISSNKDDEKDNANSAVATLPPAYSDDANVDVNSTVNNSAVQEYIDKNKAALISAMESTLASSGMNCKTSIEVEGNGFTIIIKLLGVDGVTSSAKAEMQSNLDAMQSYYDTLLTGMKTELPELEYLVYALYEEDGDFLAEVVAGNR